MTANPPKPRFALSVGVIGHRFNRLPEAARGKVAAEVDNFILLFLRAAESAHASSPDYFAQTSPSFSLISALAEGADRIAADAAIKAGLSLDVSLPFAQEIYEEDFAAAGSTDQFRDLLGKARSVLTLPGDRAFPKRAYEAAGLTVIAQSDILLVIWDGGPSAGRGGTTELIQFALRAGLPLVHVDATGKAPTKIIWHGLAPLSVANDAIEEIASSGLDELPRVISTVTRPPSDPDERRDLAHYFDETNNHRLMRPEFPVLQALARVAPPVAVNTRPPDPNKVSAHLYPADVPPEQVGVLAAAYGWADALGVYYAQTFRGAFVMNFVLAAMAVVFAALSLIIAPKWLFVSFEVICIFMVLVNTSIGFDRNWHGRWLESREVAERLRAALLLWVLGLRPGIFSEEEPSWTGWYVRALFREQGLRAGDIDAKALISARASLLLLLESQCNYHRTVTAPRMRTLNYVLEKAGEFLLTATLVVAISFLVATAANHFLGMPFPAEAVVKYVVAAVSAALPALATAFYGIRVIGDFEGYAHRSTRMDATLRKLNDAIQKDPVDLFALRARSKAVAEVMLSDVASWRLVAESRTLPTV